jgi:hypothetical protein
MVVPLLSSHLRERYLWQQKETAWSQLRRGARSIWAIDGFPREVWTRCSICRAQLIDFGKHANQQLLRSENARSYDVIKYNHQILI